MAGLKPTILLIHGCFGGSDGYDRLVPYLEQAGYPTTNATFPSLNPKSPQDVTAQLDIDHVRDVYLLPLVDKEQKDVVIVVHSYGGVVGAAAAVGLSKSDRVAQKLAGGVIGLIYISGNIVKENQSLRESAGGQWPPWLAVDKPGPGLAVMEPLIETMYNDADPTLEPELKAAMLPHGYRCLETKVSAPCWAEKGYTGRLAYIRTLQDQVNPLFVQDMMIEGSGVHWDTTDMDTSHTPTISAPGELAQNIATFVTRFESLKV